MFRVDIGLLCYPEPKEGVVSYKRRCSGLLKELSINHTSNIVLSGLYAKASFLFLGNR